MVLRGKVAIVTGASSGIGAAAAIDLAKKGADVVIVGRNEAKLAKVTVDIEKAAGKKPIVVIAELTNDDEAKRIIDVTVTTFGKIDILVNNAGIANFNSILEPNAIETFDKVIKTNLRAVVVITQYAIPYLIASNGNIINISSVASEMTLKNSVVYCTSKAGLDHYSKCLAYALADHGVRVNTVNPGPVKTDIFQTQGLTEIQLVAAMETMKKITPLQRISEPSEVSELVTYLASDKAKAVTGSKFCIDNGMRLNPVSLP